MSLPPRTGQLSFFDAPILLDDLLDEQDEYRLFRQEVLPALEKARPALAEMYCQDNGRAGIEPVVLAGVTLLQFMYKCPDRQAVRSVRLDLGWKFALGLGIQYKGFDPTSLVHFRLRLLEHDKARVVFDAILAGLRDSGRLRRRARQRLDSTHVLGCVSTMSRLEVVRESLRLTVEMIGRQDPPGRPAEWDALVERYCHSTVEWRGQSKEQLEARFLQAGQDALGLIQWLRGQAASIRDHDKSLLLERVFLEQYALTSEGIDPLAVPGSGVVKNPHDPDAQWACKDLDKTKTWTGYKAQVSETVDEEEGVCDKGEPTEQFLVDLTTTEAIASDLDGMQRSLEAQQSAGQDLPPVMYVDAGYVSGQTLAQARQQERELVGPPRPSPQQKGVYTAEEFDVDVAHRKAVCPAGRTSSQCSHIHDAHQGGDYYRFEWGAQCDDCPQRKACTTARSGRRVLSVGPNHDLLQQRRRLAQAPEYRLRMRQRNAIEGTISELTRLGMRRTRYRGLAKTGLANHMLAAACNARRWVRRIAWETSMARKTA
jgi:hypothetical protein